MVHLDRRYRMRGEGGIVFVSGFLSKRCSLEPLYSPHTPSAASSSKQRFLGVPMVPITLKSMVGSIKLSFIPMQSQVCLQKYYMPTAFCSHSKAQPQVQCFAHALAAGGVRKWLLRSLKCQTRSRISPTKKKISPISLKILLTQRGLNLSLQKKKGG